MNTDRIDKEIWLRAPQARVWAAISDAAAFGRWFGVRFDAPFAEGATITGRITPTEVDAEVAKLQEPHAGTPFTFIVERIAAMHTFAFRWHPYAIDADADYREEPMTLVVFELKAQDGGTLLHISESGFDRIPLARRAAAFAANDGGWSHQLRLIEKYLALQGGA
jgi:uncharacterized protein YndB with AHSA1/START domain